jgi:hypothetical protein
MTDKYEEGYRAAHRHIISNCLRHVDPENRSEAALKIERDEAIAKLREICAIYGDNKWEDSLNLPDILEKHLFRNLCENARF